MVCSILLKLCRIAHIEQSTANKAITMMMVVENMAMAVGDGHGDGHGIANIQNVV